MDAHRHRVGHPRRRGGTGPAAGSSSAPTTAGAGRRRHASPIWSGTGEARSSLDAIRAADQLEGLRLSSDVVVWGHSQGGHAALWTEQVAADYAPELAIHGTAALAPVADPLAHGDAS